jgi:hypothetical protein
MPTIARPLVFANFAGGISVDWGQWGIPIQIVDNDLPFLAGGGPNQCNVTVRDVQLFGHDIFVDRGVGMRRGFAQNDRLLIALIHLYKRLVRVYQPMVRCGGHFSRKLNWKTLLLVHDLANLYPGVLMNY